MDSSTGEKGPQSNERGEQKKQAELLRQKKAEMAYLENQFKSTRDALLRNPDPFAQRHLVSVLGELEGRIVELAKQHDFDQPISGIARLHEKTPEDLKREAQIELDKLRVRKTQHENDILFGDPVSRERLYEFEHDARQIAKKYGLDETHILDFIVPDEIAQVPLIKKEALLGVSPNQGEQLTENATAKKESFLKGLFKRETKEEKAERAYAKDRDSILISLGAMREKYNELTAVEDPTGVLSGTMKKVLGEARGAWSRLRPEDQNPELLGNMASALSKAPVDEELPSTKESLAEKIKRGFRKYFAVGLFTATAVGVPLKTSDTRLAREEIIPKTEAVAPVNIAEGKTNTGNVSAEIASRPASEKQTPKELPAIKKIPFDSLRQVRDNAHQEMLGERKIDTASVFNTPIETDTSTSEEVVFPTYPNEAPAPVASEYPPLPVAPVSPGQNPNTVRSTTAPVAMGLESAAPYASVGKALYDDPTRSHPGKIKVAYFDKMGNTLDTGAIRNEQSIVYTPMPKKIVEASPAEKKVAEKKATRDTVSSHGPESVAPAPRRQTENLRPYVRPTMGTVRTETIPAQIESALPGRPHSYGSADTIRVDTTENIPGWRWGKAPGDYVYKRLTQPTNEQLNNGEFLMRDPEFFVLPNGVEIPHFIRLRMDDALLKAFNDAPAALALYTEKTRHGETQDPYIITIWNGNNGTEYVIGENGLLATKPRPVARTTKVAYGNLEVKIESGEAGASLSVNGESLSNYEQLSQEEKDQIAYICSGTGKNTFNYFSIDNTPAVDGTFSKFDLHPNAHYALVNTSRAQILEETQLLLDVVWENYRIREYLTTVEEMQNGVRVENSYWRRDYDHRPAKIIRTLAEKKSTTRETKKPRILNKVTSGAKTATGAGTGGFNKKKTSTSAEKVKGKTKKQGADTTNKNEQFDIYQYR